MITSNIVTDLTKEITTSIVIEGQVGGEPAILLENGSYLLLENGSKILLE